MRSIWNGAIAFGLVSIPVKLMNATENHTISFRQIHTEDGGRIRYRKVCELDDQEVDSAEIGKAYEDADGTMIPITDEDLAHLPPPTAKTIDIVAFVPSDSVDPLQMETAYYLSANGAPATKPYTLLREALKRTEKVAIARFALRGRERLGMLRVTDDVIALHGLLWPDEIRTPEDVAPGTADVKVRDKELDLADALMDTLGEVDLADLHDEYREALEEVVAAKASGEEIPHADSPKGDGKVIDLMAALENSVKAARESRDGDGGSAEVRHINAGAKKKPAKKAAVEPRKSSKRTTGSKSATKKSTSKKATKKSATKTSASGSSNSGNKTA
ncbi:Ku protein [Streptomyces sp. NPDC090306]|uniref:non-homologous end joining protein Ku n=1 Tax=Streptomyces sp. NPDC090306 TaxID=3365961 RepID=UPI0038180CD5